MSCLCAKLRARSFSRITPDEVLNTLLRVAVYMLILQTALLLQQTFKRAPQLFTILRPYSNYIGTLTTSSGSPSADLICETGETQPHCPHSAVGKSLGQARDCNKRTDTSGVKTAKHVRSQVAAAFQSNRRNDTSAGAGGSHQSTDVVRIGPQTSSADIEPKRKRSQRSPCSANVEPKRKRSRRSPTVPLLEDTYPDPDETYQDLFKKDSEEYNFYISLESSRDGDIVAKLYNAVDQIDKTDKALKLVKRTLCYVLVELRENNTTIDDLVRRVCYSKGIGDHLDSKIRKKFYNMFKVGRKWQLVMGICAQIAPWRKPNITTYREFSGILWLLSKGSA